MPGVANPAGMTVSYNGYTFPVSLEPPKIAISPKYDTAGRVVVACQYTISLDAIIYTDVGDQDASVQMASLRQRLSAPACELNIVGTGFSDFTVNAQGGRVWDCEWGPKPQVTQCQQIGDNKAWRISWTCSTVVPEECPEDTKPQLGRWFEWCYSIRWSIDLYGLTTRTISGHVMVPLTRLKPDSRLSPDDSADRLREQVKNLAPLEGFRRIPGEATLSEDRRRLDFSVTDQQLASPFSPPPGVILCSGRHDQANQGTNNWFQYVHTISASYTMGRNVRKSNSLRLFIEMVVDRWRTAQVNNMFIIPLTFSASEELWTMTTSYTIRYTTLDLLGQNLAGANDAILRRLAMQRGITRSGLWVAPVRTKWADWSQSFAQNAHDARGYAGLHWDPQDDFLMNICVNKGAGLDLLPDADAKLRAAPPPDDPPQVFQGVPPREFGPDPRLNPENSWLMYQLSATIREIDDVAHFKLLSDEEVRYKPKDRPLYEPGPHPLDYERSKQTAHVFQFRGQPTYELVVEGKALRAAHDIARPSILEAGGVAAYPVRDRNDYFVQEIFGNYLTPIAAAKWRLTYILDGTPKRAIGAPDHPIHGKISDSGDTLTGFTALT